MAKLNFRRVDSLPTTVTDAHVGGIFFVGGNQIYVCVSSTGDNKFIKYADVREATNAAAGLMSAADKAKLDGMTKVTSWSADGEASDSNIPSEKLVYDTITENERTVAAALNKLSEESGASLAYANSELTLKNAAGTALSTVTITSTTVTESETNGKIKVNGTDIWAYNETTGTLEPRITALEGKVVSGMHYRGTTASKPASGEVGDVYRVITNSITIPAAESGTGADAIAEPGDFLVCKVGTVADPATAAIWDVWQGNLNKGAFWDTNTPVDAELVIADGTTGKVKSSGKTISDFAAASHSHAASEVTAMTDYSKASASAAIATSDSLNTAIGKLEYKADDTITRVSALEVWAEWPNA